MPKKLGAVSPDGATAHARFEGFALPTSNTTYCPNQFFDVCLPHRSRGCVRLVAYLIRKTLGWCDEHGKPQAEQHQIPFNEFERRAGINRDMIKPAIDEAIRNRFVTRPQLGRPNRSGERAVSALYELQWDETDQYQKDPKQFRGFFAGEGNRTYIPNQFFDVVIPGETLAVIKVVGSIIRFSIGFQNKFGHRRQVVALSYQDIQNYSKIRNRGTLSAAIESAIQKNYIQRVEEGYFDKDAGKLSRAATYALKWLNPAIKDLNGRKNVPEEIEPEKQSEIRTGNGRKNVPEQRSEKRTDIQIKQTNKTIKQQDHAAAAFSRLREEGFDEGAAQAIASAYSAERIHRQIDWIDQRHAKRNRLGLLRSAIEHDWRRPGSRRLDAEAHVPRSAGGSFSDALKQAKHRLLRDQSNQPTT